MENGKIHFKSKIWIFNINFQNQIIFFNKPALKHKTKVVLTSKSSSVNIVTYVTKIVATNFWPVQSLKYVWFSRFFYLLWKFHRTLHSLCLKYFLSCNYHSGYTGWKFYIRTGNVLILKNKAIVRKRVSTYPISKSFPPFLKIPHPPPHLTSKSVIPRFPY